MNPGELFWIDFPPRGGHAQSGRRPALIIQGVSATPLLPTVLVVPLTTQMGALRFPGAILIAADEENGLRQDSVALVFQLTSLDQRAVGERLGRVSPEVMKQLWQAFDEITDRLEFG